MNFEEVKQKYIDDKVKVIESLKDFNIESFFQYCADHGVAKFSWCQYTPYFNDGDTCEFSVHEEIGDIEIDGIEEEFTDTYELYDYKNGNRIFKSEVHEKAYNFSLFDALPLPEEMFLNLFGDHAEITVDVKSKTFDVSVYDHD